MDTFQSRPVPTNFGNLLWQGKRNPPFSGWFVERAPGTGLVTAKRKTSDRSLASESLKDHEQIELLKFLAGN